jgi:hypothetical protein
VDQAVFYLRRKLMSVSNASPTPVSYGSQQRAIDVQPGVRKFTDTPRYFGPYHSCVRR